jgi:hypothetical protein
VEVFIELGQLAGIVVSFLRASTSWSRTTFFQKGEVLSTHYINQFQVFSVQSALEREAYKDAWMSKHAAEKLKRKTEAEDSKRQTQESGKETPQATTEEGCG